jgi:hypothetical protein
VSRSNLLLKKHLALEEGVMITRNLFFLHIEEIDSIELLIKKPLSSFQPKPSELMKKLVFSLIHVALVENFNTTILDFTHISEGPLRGAERQPLW